MMLYVLLLTLTLSTYHGDEIVNIQVEYPTLKSCVRASLKIDKLYPNIATTRCRQQA